MIVPSAEGLVTTKRRIVLAVPKYIHSIQPGNLVDSPVFFLNFRQPLVGS